MLLKGILWEIVLRLVCNLWLNVWGVVPQLGLRGLILDSCRAVGTWGATRSWGLGAQETCWQRQDVCRMESGR